MYEMSCVGYALTHWRNQVSNLSENVAALSLLKPSRCSSRKKNNHKSLRFYKKTTSTTTKYALITVRLKVALVIVLKW